MNVKILSKEQIDSEIAQTYIDLVNSKPNCVLGFATGSSPLGVYANLVKACKEGKVSFKDVTSFNLDEYVGLKGDHNQSYRYFMNTNLFDHIDIKKENTNVPQGIGDLEGNCVEYEEKIAKCGPIELQILGIGSDGHIAFNEPDTSFESLTHITALTDQTIKDNARFFESISDVPTHAITMGLKSIMNCKKIVLVATGANKAVAVKELVEGEKSEAMPCTILKDHADVTIYIDEAAASLLSK